MPVKPLLKAGLLFVLFWPAACTVVPRQTPQLRSKWEDHRMRCMALQQWQLNASIAAHSAQEGFDARLNWRQRNDSYELRLYGPLGQGTVLIQGDHQGVTMRAGDNQTVSAPTADVLMEQATGLSLPVELLLHWIRGIPAPYPQPSLLEVNDAGLLLNLHQSGWRLEYSEYTKAGDLELPRKFTVKNNEYVVKFVVSKWDV